MAEKKKEKVTSSIGVASLFIGIIACCMAVIPRIGIYAIPLAGIGVLLALIGVIVSLMNQQSTILFQIAGFVIGIIAMVFTWQWALSSGQGGIRSLFGLSPKEDVSSENATVNSNTPADGDKPAGSLTYQEMVELAIQRNKENRDKDKTTGSQNAHGNSKTASNSSRIADFDDDDEYDENAPEGNWHDATKGAVSLHDIKVWVSSVVIGKKIEITDGKERQSDDNYILIYLYVENNSSNYQDAHSWSRFGYDSNRDTVQLVDNNKNEYKRAVVFYNSSIKHGYTRVTLYPEQLCRDVIAFEKPVAGVKCYYLTLPGRWIDDKEKDSFRFKIPASMIQRQ